MDALRVVRADPEDPAFDLLFARHVADMHAETPPESIHMLPRGVLNVPGIVFLGLFDGAEAVGMGALKALGEGLGELKSMHVLAERRGQGLSRRMLDALLAEARARGMTRVALETGTQPGFAAARGLYAAAGFAETGPFGSYREDPSSVYMACDLG